MKIFYYTLFVLCSSLCTMKTQQGLVFPVHSENSYTRPVVQQTPQPTAQQQQQYQKQNHEPQKPIRMSRIKKAFKWIGFIAGVFVLSATGFVICGFILMPSAGLTIIIIGSVGYAIGLSLIYPVIT